MSHSSTSSQISISPPPSPRLPSLTTTSPSTTNSHTNTSRDSNLHNNSQPTTCHCEMVYKTYRNCNHQVPEQTLHAKDCKHYDEHASGSCDGKRTLSRVLLPEDGEEENCPLCRDLWLGERFRGVW
ncbi:hypothetical protein HYALB_00008700 [Hymenoscyphus albidus]|uniref:Uncharacterized protein n=1 Tax=Hymenoscyphus albidus TaxID=595503 RepID=A0A9N9Q2R9_9HELO|nr:hypothetical protein HYALB_00008700 [Hymenoscyphus albidus]